MRRKPASSDGVEGRRGVALILALWILVLLSFLGLEMSVFSRADTGTTRYLKERVQTYYLARGGVERGVGLLAEYNLRYPTSRLATKARRVPMDQVTGPRPPLLTYLADRGLEKPLGEGSFRLRFEDLSGRLNVNRVEPELLANLAQLTGLDRSTAEQITDAILDWIDADDLHRGRGAERSWYERRDLPPPRNTPILQLEELLLVKGMTHEIFYGGGRLKGLAHFLTNEGSGKVNVNTAPAEVLLAVVGMDRTIVTQILAQRQRRHLRSLEDALGTGADELLMNHPNLNVFSFETTEMRIEATGALPGSRTRARVRATVGILPAGVVVRNWVDDFPAGLALAPGAAVRLPERQ